MSSKSYATVTATLFLLIAVGHLLRLGFKWSAVIGGWTVPMWVSVVAVVVAGFLSYQGFKICHHS